MIKEVIRYVCGRCGGMIVGVYTTEDDITTAHIYCEKCDKEALERGKTKDVKK